MLLKVYHFDRNWFDKPSKMKNIQHYICPEALSNHFFLNKSIRFLGQKCLCTSLCISVPKAKSIWTRLFMYACFSLALKHISQLFYASFENATGVPEISFNSRKISFAQCNSRQGGCCDYCRQPKRLHGRWTPITIQRSQTLFADYFSKSFWRPYLWNSSMNISCYGAHLKANLSILDRWHNHGFNIFAVK